MFSLVLLAAMCTRTESIPIQVPIRLMTYNVMRGRYNCFEQQLKNNPDFLHSAGVTTILTRVDFIRCNLATIARLIRQYDPDVLALQEVQEQLSFSLPIEDQISTAAYLAEQLNMTYIFSPTLFDNEVRMQYGTAILINRHRLRLIAVEIIPLPLGLEARNSPCLSIRNTDYNVTFRACSIHFDHNPIDPSIRIQQARTMIDWASKQKYCPTVLLGDFNGNSSSQTIATLSQLFDDRLQESNRPTWSECGEMLKDKIDFILLDKRAQWTVQRFLHGLEMTFIPSVKITMLSDHVPLFAETMLTVDNQV